MRSSYCCRSCLAFLLKLLNFLQTFLGVSIVIYSIWMLNVWNRHGSVDGETVNADLHDLPAPWFVYSFMGIGVLLCLMAFIGHIASESINGCCLCFHALLTTVLIFLEAALVGYLVFNKHWKEDLPSEPTGELERLQAFIESNIDVCKWVGITVVVIQALSLLLAMVLRAMVSTKKVDYDSDEEIAVVRKPLLYTQYGSTSAESKGIHSGTWSARIREKYGLN